jgi:hypothetical protein
MDLAKLLKQNPEWKLLSKSKLYQKAKEYGISKQDIDDYVEDKELYQVYKPKTNNTNLKITSPPYSFQIDIVLLPKYKFSNNNIKQFLLCVDILSRKAFAYPLKKGTMSEVLKEYENFIIDADHPINSVSGDAFFNNAVFKAFNDEMLINLYTDVAKLDHITGSGDKLGVLDRCVRTLKQFINKYILDHDNTKWTKWLHKIIDLYNNTPNSGIKDMTPNEVYDDYDYCLKLYENQKKKNNKVFSDVDLKVNDKVRVLKDKKEFGKEQQRFSSEIYTIIGIKGYKFKLQDEDGDDVSRLYKPDELQKIKKVNKRISSKAKDKDEEKDRNERRLMREGI